MAVNENKEGYIFAKDRYVFAERYGAQLESALQGVLAFSIAPFDGFYIETTKTGETAKTTIRKIGIKFCEPLLPRHCNPELIEEALAALQSAPENLKLLEVLGEYAKNDLFEQKTANYTTRLFGILVYSFLLLAFLGTFPLLPLMLPVHITLIFFAVNLVGFLTSCVAFVVASGILGNNIRGLKFGRWVGDLIKGNNREPANLTELDDNLHALINECKINGIVGEAAKGQLKEGMEEPQVVSKKSVSAAATQYSSLYPSLRLFPKDSISTDQDAASNTHDNSHESRTLTH